MSGPGRTSEGGVAVALRAAAAAAGIAVVPISLWLPVHSSGGSLTEDVGASFYAALAIGVVVACLPFFTHGPRSRRVASAAGLLLVLGSFVTVLGVFFLPAALLLLLSAWAERGSGPMAGTGRSHALR